MPSTRPALSGDKDDGNKNVHKLSIRLRKAFDGKKLVSPCTNTHQSAALAPLLACREHDDHAANMLSRPNEKHASNMTR